MVSSVGPYRFSIMEFGAASAQALTTSTGRASPQNRLRRTDGYIPGLRVPSFFMKTAVDGTENQVVNCDCRMNFPGLIEVFCDGQQREAPLSHVANMSCTDRSKVMSNVCEQRSF